MDSQKESILNNSQKVDVMKTQNVQKQKGFTLVEIAIVLVIIGLLLGGVLKGQELIQNSKVKSVIADFEGISAGYWAFRDRRGSYPSADDSNGAFWTDLRSEGFISGLSSNTSGPEHALDGEFSYLSTGAPFGANEKSICAADVPNVIALNIDVKLDDGDYAAETGNASGDVRSATAYDSASEAGILLCKRLK